MTQQPPREPPREPDPTDADWVDHILDQLTSRPMPAGPDVEAAPPEDAGAAEPPPEPDLSGAPSEPPADAPEEPADPDPSPPVPPEAPAAAPGALLDELLAMHEEPADEAPAAEPPPLPPPPPPAPPKAPAPPEPVTPPPAAAPPPDAGTPPPVPPAPPPRAPIPPAIPPPPRRAPRPAAAPPRPYADPMLGAAPPRPGREPPRPRPYRDDSLDAEILDAEYDEQYPAEFDEHLEESQSRWRTVLGWAITVALAVVLSLVIRSFVAHAFHVESGSMEPTLTPGDRILVNKLAENPSRGDLVVFSRPDGDLVKRVVALEGETVYFDEGLVKIGDKWLQEPYLSAGTGTYVRSAIPSCDPPAGSEGAEACTVPEGHVFVLGDNRGVSFDSRNFGPIPREDLIGSAAFQFWPLGDIRGF